MKFFESFGPLTKNEAEEVEKFVKSADPKALLDIIIEDGRKRLGLPDTLSKLEVARAMDKHAEENAKINSEPPTTEKTPEPISEDTTVTSDIQAIRRNKLVDVLNESNKEGLLQHRVEPKESPASKSNQPKTPIKPDAVSLTSENRKEVFKTIAEKWFVRTGLKEIITHKDPDLDAKISVELLRFFGVEIDGVALIKKGQYEPEKNPDATGTYFDVGNQETTTIENNGKRVFMDNHSEFSITNPTSATKLTYEGLIGISELEEFKDEPWFKKLNTLLKENKVWVEKMVRFVNEWDNLSYETSEEFFKKDFGDTLYGIQRELPIEVIFKLFQNPDFDPRKPFSEEDKKIEFNFKELIKPRRPEKIDKRTGKIIRPAQELEIEEKTITIGDLTKKAQKTVAESIDGIKNAYAIPNHPIFEKLLVNVVDKIGKNENGEIITDNKIIHGSHAVKSMGYDTYLTFNRSISSFFLNSFKRDLNDILPQIQTVFPRAIISRGRMILHNLNRKDIANGLDLKPYDLEKLLDILKIQLEIKKQSPVEIKSSNNKPVISTSKPEKPKPPIDIENAVKNLEWVLGKLKPNKDTYGIGSNNLEFANQVIERLSKKRFICKIAEAKPGDTEIHLIYESLAPRIELPAEFVAEANAIKAENENEKKEIKRESEEVYLKNKAIKKVRDEKQSQISSLTIPVSGAAKKIEQLRKYLANKTEPLKTNDVIELPATTPEAEQAARTKAEVSFSSPEKNVARSTLERVIDQAIEKRTGNSGKVVVPKRLEDEAVRILADKRLIAITPRNGVRVSTIATPKKESEVTINFKTSVRE